MAFRSLSGAYNPEAAQSVEAVSDRKESDSNPRVNSSYLTLLYDTHNNVSRVNGTIVNDFRGGKKRANIAQTKNAIKAEKAKLKERPELSYKIVTHRGLPRIQVNFSYKLNKEIYRASWIPIDLKFPQAVRNVAEDLDASLEEKFDSAQAEIRTAQREVAAKKDELKRQSPGSAKLPRYSKQPDGQISAITSRELDDVAELAKKYFQRPDPAKVSKALESIAQRSSSSGKANTRPSNSVKERPSYPVSHEIHVPRDI